jgi:hypothetical protein
MAKVVTVVPLGKHLYHEETGHLFTKRSDRENIWLCVARGSKSCNCQLNRNDNGEHVEKNEHNHEPQQEVSKQQTKILQKSKSKNLKMFFSRKMLTNFSSKCKLNFLIISP